jgi:hypothetical protein
VKNRPELPDRVSLDKRSPFYRPDLTALGIGIRFKGQVKTNVYEYCVSEGWVRLLPKTGSFGRDGEPVTLKTQGKVEPYWR